MTPDKDKQSITYADYLEQENRVLCEVFAGQLFYISTAPTPEHQHIIAGLSAEFVTYLREKACQSYFAPIDVWLFDLEGTSPKKVKNWVQPDLLVVCDKSKIGDKRIYGAPDLIVEVMSPSTARQDKGLKFKLYEKAGVREYWIVDPLNQLIEVYVLEEETFRPDGVYTRSDHIPVGITKELSINLDVIFSNKDGV